MIDCGDKQKLGKGNEEFNRFEEELVQRHRAQMVEELRGKLEEIDRVAAEELLKTGRFVDKGYVRRKIQTSVGAVWVRIKRLKRKGRSGSVYALFDICGVSRVSERAQRHSVQVAMEQAGSGTCSRAYIQEVAIHSMRITYRRRLGRC